MSSHLRVLLFCVVLLVAPGFWVLGVRLGGEWIGLTLTAVAVGAAAVYAQRGQGKPPAGDRPVS